MPRTCSVCSHPDRQKIDRLLLEQTLRDVSGQTGIGKSALGRHKLAHLPGALVLANEQEIERHRQLFDEAQSLQRSLAGWGAVREPGEWLELRERAVADYESGRFLLTRLGAERHLDPEQVATLLHLRGRIIDEMHLTTGLELMLLDAALIAFRNMLLIEEWIGNLSLLVEHHLFRDEGPTPKINRTNGRYQGLAAEDDARRLRDDLLPALDRASKNFVSAIKTLRDFHGTGVNVTIAAVGQMNVGEQQLVVGPSVTPSA